MLRSWIDMMSLSSYWILLALSTASGLRGVCGCGLGLPLSSHVNGGLLRWRSAFSIKRTVSNHHEITFAHQLYNGIRLALLPYFLVSPLVLRKMDVSDFSDLSQVLLYQLVDDPLKGLRHLLHRPAMGALAIGHNFSTCYPPLMNLETRQYISSEASFPNPFKNTGKSICMGTLSESTKQSNQKAFTSVFQMNDENLRNVDCPGFQENACVCIHIATVRTIDGY